MKDVLSQTLPYVILCAAMLTVKPVQADAPLFKPGAGTLAQGPAHGPPAADTLTVDACAAGQACDSVQGVEPEGYYRNDILCISWDARRQLPSTVNASCCQVDPDRELFTVSGEVHCCCYRSAMYEQ